MSELDDFEREKRRQIILEGIKKDLKHSEIAEHLGVDGSILRHIINFMRNNGDDGLREAEKMRSEIRAEKLLNSMRERVHFLHDDKFRRMTGLTLQEKTFQNMIEFYKPELIKIIKSPQRNASKINLSKNVRKTLIKYDIIENRRTGWFINDRALEYLNKIIHPRKGLTDLS